MADLMKADELKTRLKPADLLLIHTNNHGGNDGRYKYRLVVDGLRDFMAGK